ncbi:MAG: AbrB/MazE/SpoVT family DNA-binding domain-containing protein [Thermoplasmata archaeon]|nr:AbrB/MazE/SpoVT family DNA-binding domain-containing protein [Thermoplasmata archaeon]
MADLRRVQKTGGSTLIVSLPKRWAVAAGIKNGDTLSLIPGERGTLIIDPHPIEKDVKRVKHISIEDGDPEHFFRRLIAVYINGYDTIEVSAGSTMSAEMRAAIRRFTRMVIGPEITEEDINSVHIKDLSDSEGFGLKSVVRRIFRITFSMLHDSMNAVRNGDLEIARDVDARDAEVDRLYWLLFKQYNLMLKRPRYLQEGPDVEESLNYFLIGRILERVADHARNISKHLVGVLGNKKKTPLSPETMNYFSGAADVALDMINRAFESFLKGDVSLANKTIDSTAELKDLYTKGVSTISGARPNLSVAIAGIMESVKRAGMYASDIAEIAINTQENN